MPQSGDIVDQKIDANMIEDLFVRFLSLIDLVKLTSVNVKGSVG